MLSFNGSGSQTANMIYPGVLAKLLGLDLKLMEQALGKQLGKKAKAVILNAGALKAGWEYAEANLTKQDPFFIEPMNETAGKILIEGNAAAAIGCMDPMHPRRRCTKSATSSAASS